MINLKKAEDMIKRIENLKEAEAEIEIKVEKEAENVVEIDSIDTRLKKIEIIEREQENIQIQNLILDISHLY